MILTPEAIKQKFRDIGIRPDKFLGQHFLIDQDVLDAINSAHSQFKETSDVVVEVGPGLGVLTHSLLKGASPVVTVEKDPVFATNLAKNLDYSQDQGHLSVIQGDILEILDTNSDFPMRFTLSKYTHMVMQGALNEEGGNYAWPAKEQIESWILVANIPYAITSPLLRKLVYAANPPRHILLLVQKEVAERITAEPGNSKRGLLTVQLELLSRPRIIRTVPKEAFWPVPEVESALLQIDIDGVKPKTTRAVIPHVLRIAIAGFSTKRKKIHNSLAAGLQLPNDVVQSALKESGIDPSRRAETLSSEEWVGLTDHLTKRID